jgi:hypothetical protein
MALTKVQIVSNALMQLGHAPISSLEDGDDLVVAAEAAYDMKLPSVLSQGNWRFAVQRSQLSQLVETPPPPWQTAYSLPAGFLKTIQLYPNIYDWDIYRNERIYTYMEGELWMEYVFQPDVSHFPSHFADYFTYEISSFLALSNAEKTEYYAALEAKRKNMAAMSNAIETSNRPNFSQVLFPVLDNRYLGGLIGNSFNQ